MADSSRACSPPTPQTITTPRRPHNARPVKLIIGSAQFHQEFVVNKKLLSAAAPAFGKMLDGMFLEGTTQVTLSEYDPKAFELFVDWIYKNTIDYDDCSNILPLIHLFGFAEEYCLTQLMDNTIDKLAACQIASDTTMDRDDIGAAYKATRTGSKLRLCASRSFASIITEHNDTDLGGIWSIEELLPKGPDSKVILLDSLHHLRQRDDRTGVTDSGDDFTRDPSLAPACDYHQHEEESPCPYLSKKRKRNS